MCCKRNGWVIGLLLWLLGPVYAQADYAVLANGFRMRVTGQEENGASIRLFIRGGGYVDVQAFDVVGYEKEEILPSQPEVSSPPVWESAGWRHGLDPLLLKSLIAEESNFDPQAVSPKGAAGLMQLMPGTAAELRVEDVFDPRQNVEAGALYLRSLLRRYGGDLALALAAYNAGPEKVDQYRGIPPYPETLRYVRRVITRFHSEKSK